VQKKVDGLGRYFDRLHGVRVILRVEESKRASAEILCGLVRGRQLVAKADHEDLQQAIDLAEHKARELLRKYKDRLRCRKGERPAAGTQ
jgi:ribosomal subunit interface protein